MNYNKKFDIVLIKSVNFYEPLFLYINKSPFFWLQNFYSKLFLHLYTCTDVYSSSNDRKRCKMKCIRLTFFNNLIRIEFQNVICKFDVEFIFHQNSVAIYEFRIDLFVYIKEWFGSVFFWSVFSDTSVCILLNFSTMLIYLDH